MRNLNTGILVGALAVAGQMAVQAAPISLTAISNNVGNRSWQDIAGTSYALDDLNGNNQIDIGEKVTFTVDMHKANWGTHDFDALKVWIDGSPLNPPTSTLYTQNFIWNYNGNASYYPVYAPGQNTSFSYRPWTLGDQFFSFDYTFATAGTYYLTASVMCSADLSTLVNDGAYDRPTTADWNAWTENIHATRWLQGEDERYQLVVNAPPPPAVPEPGTLALSLIGFAGLAMAGYSRKKKSSTPRS